MERSAWGGEMNMADTIVRHQFQQRLTYNRFNEEHLRGGPIGAATNRVLVVGDSFTFGWLVDETNAFVSRLNQLVSANYPPKSFEFLNGGAPSWGTSDYVAFVENLGERIHPAAIVVFLNNDDVERSVRHAFYRLNPANSNAVVADTALFAATPKKNLRASPLFRWMVEHVELAQFVRIVLQGQEHPHQDMTSADVHGKEDTAYALQLEQALFLHLRAWCAAHHCRLLVMTTGFNGFPKFPLGLNDGAANKIFFQEASNFFSRNDIAFHDLGPELSAAVNGDFLPITIPRDFHPNERGHELIAQLAWPWLKLQLQDMLAAKADNSH